MQGVRDRPCVPCPPGSDPEVHEREEFKVRLEVFILGFVGGFLLAFLFFLMRIFAAQEYICEADRGYDSMDGYYTDFDPYHDTYHRDETTNE